MANRFIGYVPNNSFCYSSDACHSSSGQEGAVFRKCQAINLQKEQFNIPCMTASKFFCERLCCIFVLKMLCSLPCRHQLVKIVFQLMIEQQQLNQQRKKLRFQTRRVRSYPRMKSTVLPEERKAEP